MVAAVSSLLERVVATLCPVVSGLAVVTFVIFSVMAFVAEWILPHWRAQWTYFEDNLCADRWECRNYGSFMYLLHTPILLAAVIDVDRREHGPRLRERYLAVAVLAPEFAHRVVELVDVDAPVGVQMDAHVMRGGQYPIAIATAIA